MGIISASLEDYMEVVYNIYLKENKVKAVDVARALNVSRASAPEALQKLEQLGLIDYGHYGSISVTEEGIKKALEVIKKHSILSTFFKKILEVNHITAEETACKIEHVIPNEIVEKLEKLIDNYAK